MNADTVMQQGATISAFPLTLAAHLPHGPIRFVGFILALPAWLVTTLCSVPWVLVALCLMAIEDAE